MLYFIFYIFINLTSEGKNKKEKEIIYEVVILVERMPPPVNSLLYYRGKCRVNPLSIACFVVAGWFTCTN